MVHVADCCYSQRVFYSQLLAQFRRIPVEEQECPAGVPANPQDPDHNPAVIRTGRPAECPAEEPVPVAVHLSHP
jgi:hypothetical protein